MSTTSAIARTVVCEQQPKVIAPCCTNKLKQLTGTTPGWHFIVYTACGVNSKLTKKDTKTKKQSDVI